MQFLLPLALLAAFAQQPACAEVKAALEHPVDDYIAEINKEKSKRKNRNKNPLPSNICVFGLCAGTRPRGGEAPKPPDTPPAPRAPQDSDASSSKDTQTPGLVPTEASCPEFAHDPIAAAENADVGDFYFNEKKYRAALSRYQEADQQKPDDPAIHVRLARAHERLDQRDQARKYYQLAADGREGFWTAEAKAGLNRLQITRE